jgi:hypothetical protein
VHAPGLDIRGYDGRLGHDDAAPANVHERVGGPEVDRHVVDAEARGQVPAGGVPVGSFSTEADGLKGVKSAVFAA